MDKKLAKALKDANKKLKDNKIFKNYEITVNGDFTNEYNMIQLTSKKGRIFPIGNAETTGEAAAIVNAYMVGLGHGKDNSYPKFCDLDDN